jgi:hypothetical protein
MGTQPSSTPWNSPALHNDTTALAEAFLNLSCAKPAFVLSDAAGEVIARSGPIFSSMSHHPDASENTRFALQFKMTDTQFMPAFDVLVERYLALIGMDSHFFLLADYGNINSEVAMQWAGPADISTLTRESAFSFALTKCESQSAFGTFALTASADNAKASEGKYHSRFSIRMDMTVPPTYEAMFEKNMQDIAEKLIKEPQPLKDLGLEKVKKERILSALQPVIPKISPLSPMAFGINGEFLGNAGMTEGELTLHSVEISAAPYGITAKGRMALAPGSLVPTGEMRLDCRRCGPMHDDLQAWSARLSKAIWEVRDGSEPLPSSPVLNMTAFLAELAPAQGEMQTLMIRSSPETMVTINGKSVDEVQGLYAKHLEQDGEPVHIPKPEEQ